MLWWTTALLLQPACNPQAEPDEPSPYIYDEPAQPEPAYTPEQVGAAVDELLIEIWALNAAPVLAAYSAAVEGTDDYCPNWYEDDGNVFWYDDCSAESGTAFSGYGFSESQQGVMSEDGWLYDVDSMFAVASIVTAEGHTFTAGGSATLVAGEQLSSPEEHAFLYQSQIAGSFTWDGDEAEGTWMGTELSPSMFLMGYYAPEANGHYVQIEGGVSGLGGVADTAELQGITIFDQVMGSTCFIEPAGAISVRDPDGNWYDVLYDGPSEDNPVTDPAACDGCGAMYFRGDYQGEACSDFSTLLDWEERPW